MIRPTNGKYLLSFSGGPFLDMDSGLLSTSLSTAERAYQICYHFSVASHFSQLGEMIDTEKEMNPLHFGSNLMDT